MEKSEVLIGTVPTIHIVIALAVALAMLIVVLAAAVLIQLNASEREAAKRHAQQVAQWEAARSALLEFSTSVTFAAHSMVDLAGALRNWAAIPPAHDPPFDVREAPNFSSAQCGAVIQAREQYDTDPEKFPHFAAGSDPPTLRSYEHPPEPMRDRVAPQRRPSRDDRT